MIWDDGSVIDGATYLWAEKMNHTEELARQGARETVSGGRNRKYKGSQ